MCRVDTLGLVPLSASTRTSSTFRWTTYRVEPTISTTRENRRCSVCRLDTPIEKSSRWRLAISGRSCVVASRHRLGRLAVDMICRSTIRHQKMDAPIRARRSLRTASIHRTRIAAADGVSSRHNQHHPCRSRLIECLQSACQLVPVGAT